MFQAKHIGVIESCYPDKFGTPRQPGLVSGALAKIKINREWQPEQALQGLEGFTHLWVIFEFHKNSNTRYHAKVHPPRLQGASIGVFATRSPHRPNAMGLSLVKIEKIEADTVFISGVDLIDGTPVLDIKPYLPSVESISDAKGGWADRVSSEALAVIWNQEQLDLIAKWSQQIQQPGLKDLIENTLRLDPRPQVYKGEGEDKYRDVHAVRFYNGDVHFSFIDSGSIEIKKILF